MVVDGSCPATIIKSDIEKPVINPTYMKKILVPCDFSAHSKDAYKFALEIASVSKGEIYVIHHIELPLIYETTLGVQPRLVDSEARVNLKERATRAFKNLKETFHTPANTVVHFQMLDDFILPGIRTFIQEYQIDLVIMGTNGSSGLEEFLIGSNAEKVVRFSSIPVIAVKNAYAYEAIQDIVFPNNLELNQADLVNHVTNLQQFFNAKLHILNVATPSHFRTDQEAHEALNEFAHHYKLKNYTLNFRNNYNERDGILNFAKEIHANLIAIGTHGNKGLKHLINGSIAESVVNHLGCLVWTYSIRHENE
jgi:nucleotide-binding universal stress UspA family protein